MRLIGEIQFRNVFAVEIATALMPPSQFVVLEQHLQSRFGRGPLAGDCEVGLIVLVECGPAHVALPLDVQSAPAMMLDQIILPAPRVVMVDLGELPGNLIRLRLQEIGPRLVAEVAGQNDAGAVHIA